MRICAIDPSSNSGSIGIAVLNDEIIEYCKSAGFEDIVKEATNHDNDVIVIETYRTKKVFATRGQAKPSEALAVNIGIGCGAMDCFFGFVSALASCPVMKSYPANTKLSTRAIKELTGYEVTGSQHIRDAFMIAYSTMMYIKTDQLVIRQKGEKND